MKKKIEVEPDPVIRQGVRAWIERLLKGLEPTVLKNLAEELLELDEPVLGATDLLTLKLLDVLIRPNFGVISGLGEIDKALCLKGDWRQADLVAEIIDEVTPLVIDDGVVRQLWNDIHRDSAFCRIDDRHSTTIEILMAAADEKRMKFKPVKLGSAPENYEGTPSLEHQKKTPNRRN